MDIRQPQRQRLVCRAIAAGVTVSDAGLGPGPLSARTAGEARESTSRDLEDSMGKMSTSGGSLDQQNGAGIYSVERLLAAVLLTTSGPGVLSQWLALVIPRQSP